MENNNDAKATRTKTYYGVFIPGDPVPLAFFEHKTIAELYRIDTGADVCGAEVRTIVREVQAEEAPTVVTR